MTHLILYPISVIVHIISIIYAIYLMKKTGWTSPWVAFISAIFLMGLRGIIIIYLYVSKQVPNPGLEATLGSFTISCLILIGLGLVAASLRADEKNRIKLDHKIIVQAKAFELWRNTNFIGIFRGDINGKILDMNDKMTSILGYSRQDALEGKVNWRELTPPEFSDLDKKSFAEAREKSYWSPYEKEYFHKDGHRIPVMLGGLPLEPSATEIIIFVLDLTELKKSLQLQQHLQYSINRHAIVAKTDVNGNITYINEKFCQISGYSEQELLGQHYRMHDSGKNSSSLVKKLMTTISNGEAWHGEVCNRAKDGSLYWVETTIIPLVDKMDNIQEYTVLCTDVTVGKLAEGKLRRTQKMEALRQLSGGIAHDFNNILGIVIGNLEVIEDSPNIDDRTLNCVKTAHNGAMRGAVLTKKLLGLSLTKSPLSTRLLVNEFINDMRDIIASSITTSIHLNIETIEDLWPVNIDAGDLEDAILNLVLNARDAMPNGGELYIETANKTFDDLYLNHNPSEDKREFAMISIRDTGTGMTDEISSRVLDPFFTTKAKGSGSGLGLSMVQGFISRSDGYIKIYSQVGKGTTFKLFIPKATTEINEQYSQDAELNNFELMGNETILIVDDEVALQKTAEIHLNRFGYKTLRASNAEEALSLIQANENIDLLFSDVIMPGHLNGFELAIKVSKLNPSIKLLLTSGFVQQHESYKRAKDEKLSKLANSLLTKPYDKKNLVVAVRKTLDENNYQ